MQVSCFMSLADVNICKICMMSWSEQVHDCSSSGIMYMMLTLHAIALNDDLSNLNCKALQKSPVTTLSAQEI